MTEARQLLDYGRGRQQGSQVPETPAPTDYPTISSDGWLSWNQQVGAPESQGQSFAFYSQHREESDQYDHM